MKNKSLLPILIVIVTLATIAMNSLANILPFNGLDTGQISDRFPVYFVPAGYVFSIWGLIYLALMAYSIYQVLPSQWNNTRLRSIAPLYILASVANVSWLLLWHYLQITLSLVAMLIILASLILIYLRLNIGREKAGTAQSLLVNLPFSLYLGWISVATIANVTTVLYNLNWGGWGISPIAWTVIMLIIGGVLAGIVQFTRRDLVYNLVFVWAFIGIAVKHSQTQAVMLTSAIIAGLILLVAIINFFRVRKPTPIP
jgi:hypothetical protein